MTEPVTLRLLLAREGCLTLPGVYDGISARGARTTPARAKALLLRLGSSEPVRDDDKMDASDNV